jgi:hypothetical protein
VLLTLPVVVSQAPKEREQVVVDKVKLVMDGIREGEEDAETVMDEEVVEVKFIQGIILQNNGRRSLKLKESKLGSCVNRRKKEKEGLALQKLTKSSRIERQ